MEFFIGYIVVVALLAAFAVSLLKKWRVTEYVQVHGNGFFSKMAGCDFCLSWWAGVAFSAASAVFSGEPALLLVPFLSTPLTRILL